MEVSKLKLILFFKKLKQVDIVKVFSFTAISTIVKMLTGLISVKFVALIIGPTGIALLGQLNNFSSIILTLACGGINNGVTKYLAEPENDVDVVRDLLSTALKITVYCSAFCGIILLLFNKLLSELVLLTPDYGYVFVVFGVTILLYALNMLITSILNGFKEFKQFVKVNIVGSIIGLIITLFLVYFFELRGALISAVTFQSVMFFVSLWMVRKLPWLSFSMFKEKFSTIIAKKYFKYSLMTFVTAATVPVSQLLLRGYVISEISVVEAGWWEGMNRISNMYLMVITTSLSVYYLPKLSEIQDKFELRSEIFRAYKFILPVITVGFLVVYFARVLIIRVLFTPDFISMSDLFLWQLIGDFFKISSWLLAFLMVAKAMTRMFIFTEVLFSVLLVGLGYYFVMYNGIVGLTQAYAINYFIYLLFMLVVFRKLVFNKKQNENI